MKSIRLAALACFFATMFATAGYTAPATTSSIMIDAQSGKVLYADNPDVLRYPASLTKLMTLYLTFSALENGTLKLDDRLKVSANAANRSPSKLGLSVGQTIDVRTAVLATIVKSANDCATVLGEALAKDERSFAVLMTDTARKLGMKNTTFKNASGLPNKAQKTTARDMAVLAAALYHHFPQYYAWFATPSFTYQGQTITTHNALLKDFEGADGMKTGYTAAAGYNIVTSAYRGSHRVIAVTLGHQQLKQRDGKVALMMDKGLAHADEKINIAQLKKEIDTKSTRTANSKSAQSKPTSVASYLPKGAAKGTFAVQTGAFASYAKAEAEAVKVKNRLSGKFAARGTHVEKFAHNGVSMYRAQVTGFSKADAQKACIHLKNKGLNCLVTTIRPDTAYAQN